VIFMRQSVDWRQHLASWYSEFSTATSIKEWERLCLKISPMPKKNNNAKKAPGKTPERLCSNSYSIDLLCNSDNLLRTLLRTLAALSTLTLINMCNIVLNSNSFCLAYLSTCLTSDTSCITCSLNCLTLVLR